jgi:tetratricopeptide (TPR) repeat protein
MMTERMKMIRGRASAAGPRRSKRAAALCACLMALGFAAAPAATAQAATAQAAKDEEIDPGPPVPRVIEPLPVPSPPPDPADPSWLRYREGLALFDDKRFGEALDAFKKAIEARVLRSDEAVASIDDALADSEAKKAGNSIASLVELFAARDLVASELAVVRAQSAGSLLKEMALLRARRVSGMLDAFMRSAKLVIEARGGSRIGDSLSALRAAAASMRHYPEAEYALGRIFLTEGEFDLAEIQFRRALDMGESLDVPSDRYAMLDALAELYRARGKTRDFELALREVADEATLFSKKQDGLRNAMERTLSRDGFDKFMLLYRVEESFARAACSKLGRLYLEAGRPLATIYLATAVNISLTEAIARIRTREPGYAYSSLADLLVRIEADAALGRYAISSGLYEDLLLLGEALAAGGSRDSARGVWRPLAAAGASGSWGRDAQAALARPAGLAGPYPKPAAP